MDFCHQGRTVKLFIEKKMLAWLSVTFMSSSQIYRLSDNTVIDKTEWSARGFKDSPANCDRDTKSVRDGKTPATCSIPAALLLETHVLVCGLTSLGSSCLRVK